MALAAVLFAAGVLSASAVKEDAGAATYLSGPAWRKTLLESEDVFAVTILEHDAVCPEVCPRLKATIDEVNEKSQGLVRYAWSYASDSVEALDGSEIRLSQLFNITQVPSILMFSAGAKALDQTMRLPAETSAQFLGSPKALFENTKQFIPTLAEPVRGLAAMDKFMSSTPSALPRVLLLAKSADAGRSSALFKKLSVMFASRAVFGFGALDADKGALATGLAVLDATSGASSLLVSAAGPHPQHYGVLLSKGTVSPWTPFTGGSLTFPTASAWLQSVLPLPVVAQIASPGDFEAQCEKGAGLCFIAFLNSEGGAPLEAFTAVAAGNYISPDYETFGRPDFRALRLAASFSWADGAAQSDVVDALRISSFPALVAYNPRKRVFAALKQSFSTENCVRFVQAMAEGMTAAGIAKQRARARGAGRGEEEGAAALTLRVQQDLSALVTLEPLGRDLPPFKKQISAAALEAMLKKPAKKAAPKPAKAQPPKAAPTAAEAASEL